MTIYFLIIFGILAIIFILSIIFAHLVYGKPEKNEFIHELVENLNQENFIEYNGFNKVTTLYNNNILYKKELKTSRGIYNIEIELLESKILGYDVYYKDNYHWVFNHRIHRRNADCCMLMAVPGSNN
jgi:hypothetical protein